MVRGYGQERRLDHRMNEFQAGKNLLSGHILEDGQELYSSCGPRMPVL